MEKLATNLKTITGTQQGIHKSVHEGTEALVGPKQSPALASTSAEVPTDNIEQDSRDHIQKIQTKVREITKGKLPFSEQYNKLVKKVEKSWQKNTYSIWPQRIVLKKKVLCYLVKLPKALIRWAHKSKETKVGNMTSPTFNID